MATILEEFEDQQQRSVAGRLKAVKKQITNLGKDALGKEGISAEEKETFKDVLSQIITTTNVGSKPKREDFINAAKELEEIQKSLSRIASDDDIDFDSDLLGENGLQGAVQKGLDFIAEQKPSLKGAAVKSIGAKMKSTSAGFIKNLAMETVSGIPFGAEVVDWMGAKMSGFGESITQGKKLSETELGVAAAFKGEEGEPGPDPTPPVPGPDPTPPVPGPDPTPPVPGPTPPAPPGDMGGVVVVEKLDNIIDLLQRGLFRNPPFLESITEDLDFMADNMEDAESRRERLRDKGAKKAGGTVVGKGMEDDGEGGGGFFGTLFGSILGNISVIGAVKLWAKKFGKNALMKGLNIAAKGFRFVPIIGAIIAPIFDGILGWFKAEEWGTSKASAVIGAAIGGTDEGGTGAFWGALKGGAAGFAVGGPLGALAGVLVGAIAGWFGGERIAKALDKISDFFSKEWTKIMDFFGFASEEDSKKLAIKRQKAEIERQKAAKKRKEGGTEFKDRRGNVIQSQDFDVEALQEAEEKLANVEEGRGEYTNKEITELTAKYKEDLATYIKGYELAKGEKAKGMVKKLVIKAEDHLIKLGVNVPRYKFKEGGIVPGKKGEPTPVMAHGEEIFFDNDASEKMHKTASLLEGTDFKSMEKFFAAGKSSAGFNILMDEFFTSGMLESKHGGMLKNTAMLFGLAGHGQMGKRDFLGSQVDKFSMGPETVMKLFERLNFFKGREKGEVGSKRRKNMDQLNALRAIQEINKSMALWGDSPEELAAIERYDKLTEEGKILERDNLSPEDTERIGQSFMKDRRWDNFMQSESNRTARQFYPLGGSQADKLIQPVANQIGATAMQQMQERNILNSTTNQQQQQPVVVQDNSVQQNVVNEGMRFINAAGDNLTGSNNDFVSRIS